MPKLLPWLDDTADSPDFPSVDEALEQPPGLLAAGGTLSPAWLLMAYQRGIFPWYSPGEPLLWWSPDPRMVLFPDSLRVTRSLKKRIRNGGFCITVDHDFQRVIHACATGHDDGTWITDEMMAAYEELHQLGYAHSVEVWHEDHLVGGLYGVALGNVFFGESMFSRMNDASKVAFALFTRLLDNAGFDLIDCQMHTPHLESLGATEISRHAFCQQLSSSISCSVTTESKSETNTAEPNTSAQIHFESDGQDTLNAGTTPYSLPTLLATLSSKAPSSWKADITPYRAHFGF